MQNNIKLINSIYANGVLTTHVAIPIWREIFGMLSQVDLCKVRVVCKFFYALSTEYYMLRIPEFEMFMDMIQTHNRLQLPIGTLSWKSVWSGNKLFNPIIEENLLYSISDSVCVSDINEFVDLFINSNSILAESANILSRDLDSFISSTYYEIVQSRQPKPMHRIAVELVRRGVSTQYRLSFLFVTSLICCGLSEMIEFADLLIASGSSLVGSEPDVHKMIINRNQRIGDYFWPFLVRCKYNINYQDRDGNTLIDILGDCDETVILIKLGAKYGFEL